MRKEATKRMAVFNIDPPPSSERLDTATQNWLNGLYETLTFMFYNLDGENLTDDFISALNINQSEEE